MLKTIARALSPLLLAAACSGSSGAGETTPPGGGGGAEPAEDPEARLRAAQESAGEALCERLFHCAVADTPPEKQSEVGNPEELEAAARAECEEAFNRSNLSPRQIQIVQRCVNEAAACEALHECLDEARKK